MTLHMYYARKYGLCKKKGRRKEKKRKDDRTQNLKNRSKEESCKTGVPSTKFRTHAHLGLIV